MRTITDRNKFCRLDLSKKSPVRKGCSKYFLCKHENSFHSISNRTAIALVYFSIYAMRKSLKENWIKAPMHIEIAIAGSPGKFESPGLAFQIIY